MPQQTVRFRGRVYPVLDCIRLGRRDFLVVENLSAGLRERYMAFDPVSPEMRAIIVLPRRSSTSRHVANLKRLAARNSGNFPMILEIHPREDSVFVVQAWVWGYDLASKLKRAAEKPETWPHPIDCFQIYRRLAHALTQIHRETGLVHGDIKPSNLVMVGNRVHLVDFGNAWSLEQAAHRPPGDGLSGAYAAPEQHRGEPFAGHSVDTFSTSVIGYQLLTRQLPYDRLGGRAGLSEHAAVKKPQPASELSPHRPLMRDEFWERIDRILSTGLALSASDRFPTSDAWLSEIETLNAILKLPSKLSPTHGAVAKVIDWLTRRFRGADLNW